MKTLVILLTTTLVMAFNSSETSDDLNIQIEDEAYIDDIPFNTENVLNDFDLNNNSVPSDDLMKIEPEKYIDDIPFNTKEIFDDHFDETSYNSIFQLKDENYIDDIPFCTKALINTFEICKKYAFPESGDCCNYACSNTYISK